jgi:hypothetical protein
MKIMNIKVVLNYLFLDYFKKDFWMINSLEEKRKNHKKSFIVQFFDKISFNIIFEKYYLKNYNSFM